MFCNDCGDLLSEDKHYSFDNRCKQCERQWLVAMQAAQKSDQPVIN